MSFSPPAHIRAACLALFFPWLYAVSVFFYHLSTRQTVDMFSLAEGFAGLTVLTYGVYLRRFFWINLLPVLYSALDVLWGIPPGFDGFFAIIGATVLLLSLLLLGWGWILAHRDRIVVEHLLALGLALMAPIFFQELGRRVFGINLFALIVEWVLK